MKLNRNKALAMIASFIILTAAIGVGVWSNGWPSTITITPQSMTSSNSYSIFYNGSSICMKNGTTGQVDYFSSNASKVLIFAADNLTSGGLISVKSGTYILTALVNISNAGVTLAGEGLSTIFEVSSSSQPMLKIAADRVTVEKLFFRVQVGITPTIGNYAVDIQPDASIYHVTVRDCFIQNVYDGVRTGKAYNVYLESLRIYNVVNDGIRIAGANDQYLSNIVMDNTPSSNGYGIHLTSTEGVWISNVDIIHYQEGIVADPSAGSTVWWAWMTNVAVDACTASGVHFTTDNGGVVGGLYWTNGWSSGNGGHGVYLEGVDGSDLSNLQIQDNQLHGVWIASGCYATRVLGCGIQSNNQAATTYDGVHVDAGVTYFTIRGNTIRIDHQRSVEIEAGASDYYSVVGNITPQEISDEGTGANKEVADNQGYFSLYSGTVESASYIVYTDGLTCFMKNGTTGKVDYSSANASQVVNNAIGNCSSGANILFRDGSYPASIILNQSGITLEGESRGSVYLTSVDNKDIIQLGIPSGDNALQNPIIKNIIFSGGGSTGHAIATTFNGSTSNYIYRLQVDNCEFLGFNGTILYLQNLEESYITRSHVIQQSPIGFYIFNNGYYAGNMHLTDNYFFGGNNGISIYFEAFQDFVDIYCEHNVFSMAGQINTTAYCLRGTSGNIVHFSSSYDRIDTMSCIVNASGSTGYVFMSSVKNGFFYNMAENSIHFIDIGARTYEFTVEANDFYCSSARTNVAGIKDINNEANFYRRNYFEGFTGSGSSPISITYSWLATKIIEGNGGYVTQNTILNVANTTATTFVFNHGLVSTANSVLPSFNFTGWTSWTWTSTTTQVTITVTGTLPAAMKLLAVDVKFTNTP